MHAETQRQHNKDERTQFFRKIYLSLCLKGLLKVLLCERWVGDWTELQHIIMAITAFLSCSSGLLNWGPGGSASLGHGPHSSIFSPTPTEALNSNCSIWGPEGPPLLGAGSLYSILSPTNSNFLCTELYYCFTPTQFNMSTVKVIPLIPSTGCTCYLYRCISYFDSSAGVNMQQYLASIFP